MDYLSKIIIFAFIVMVNHSSAQEFSGIATYKSHRKMDFKLDEDDVNSTKKKEFMAQLRKASQQEFKLNFNKEESLYLKQEKLATPVPSSGGRRIVSMSTGSDHRYQNIKEKRFTNQTEIFGKQFLIKDSLKIILWELVNETKKIGNYTCFKAQYTENYTTQTITSKGEIEDIEKEKTTIAWYTPQIPVSNGPADFYGLPGLILEINDGELTLICSKIVLYPEKAIEIKEPKRGKEVSQFEYDEIVKKKSEEQMEQFRSKSRDL